MVNNETIRKDLIKTFSRTSRLMNPRLEDIKKLRYEKKPKIARIEVI